MIATSRTIQSVSDPAGGPAYVVGSALVGAGLQFFVITAYRFVDVRFEVFVGSVLVMDVSFSTTGGVTVGGTAHPFSGNITWNSGYTPSPDVPRLSIYAPAGRPTTEAFDATTSRFYSNFSSTPVGFFTNDSANGVAMLRFSGGGRNTETGQLSSVPGGIITAGYPRALVNVTGPPNSEVTLSAAPSILYRVDDASGSITVEPDPDNFVSYTWDFGDGSALATGPSVTHEYAVGSFTGSLTLVDKYGAKSIRTFFLTITTAADAGRTVSFVHDGLGFTIRSRILGTPKTLTTDRHDGINWSAPLRTTTALQKPSLSKPDDYSRLFQMAQNVSAKTWVLEYSDDSGSTWQTMSSPFGNDASYKAVSAPAEAQGHWMVVGINASNVLVVTISTDGCKTWSSAGTVSPGSASKSVELRYDKEWGRMVLQADATLSKTTNDVTGKTAWVNF